MKTLIIVDHPSFDRSVCNRRWLDEVRKYPDDFVVHNLQSSYPCGPINAVAEQSLVENHGALVFQFPLYWFSSPPQTKFWFDNVLAPGWAYLGAHKLEGKNVALAVTTGGPESNYTKDGKTGYTLDDYLLSYKQALIHCKANFKGIYAFYGANPTDGTQVDATSIAVSARNYIDFLHSIAQ